MTVSRSADAHIVPWVRVSMGDLGFSLWDWSDAEVLGFYHRALDGKNSLWVRTPSAPAMVPQPAQQAQGVTVTTKWVNENPATIGNRLAVRLGREPTHAECVAEVARILRGEDEPEAATAVEAPEPRTLTHGELVRLAGWNHVTFAKVGTIEGYTVECGGDVPKALERVRSLRQDLAWVSYSGGALVNDGGHSHREQKRKAAEATTIAHGDLVTLEGRAYRVLVLPRCEARPVFSDPIKFEPIEN